MRVAINTTILTTKGLERYNDFVKTLFLTLAQKNSEHEFLFFVDKNLKAATPLPTNISVRVIDYNANSFLSLKWLYDVTIAKALKKWNAGVFISADGFCSLATKVPQVLIVAGSSLIYPQGTIPRLSSFLYKNFFSNSLKKAAVVATLTEAVKTDLTNNCKIADDKIFTVSIGINENYKPVEWQEREELKEQYAKGAEYFLYDCGNTSQADLLNLLKAFSIFKKWQKTNMKLVVVGDLANNNDDILGKLKTYKYREEVIMPGSLNREDLPKVVAAAYALIAQNENIETQIALIEAMQSEVPVLMASSNSLREITGEAALIINPADPNSTAEQMKRIFKDENLRSNLIKEGFAKSKEFSIYRTADFLWKTVIRLKS